MQTAAGVAAAEAAAETARLNLDYTQVKTLISGRVGKKEITPGNMITGGTASGTELTTITSIDPIYCYFDADETSVLKYQRLAQEKKRVSARDEQIPCFLQLGNEEGFPHEGVIDFVNNRVDPNTGTLRARGVFPNPNAWLQPGFFAPPPPSRQWPLPGRPHPRRRHRHQPEHQVRPRSPPRPLHRSPHHHPRLRSSANTAPSTPAYSADELIVVNGIQRAIPETKVNPQEVNLDPNTLHLTAGGAASTQALPATRFLPATVPTNHGATHPATRPTAEPTLTRAHPNPQRRPGG